MSLSAPPNFEMGSWDKQSVKNLQKRVTPIGLTTNIYDIINSLDSENEIQQLRKLLQPGEHVMQLFKKLGEEFTPSSGARALSHDLSYLESIIVKRGNELSIEEKGSLQAYLDGVRQQMQKLEQIFSSIQQKLDTLIKSTPPDNNDAYKNRIAEIERALNSTDKLETITTSMTHNFNEIIENIRACLGCLRKEVNNDTNLSFGDSNKFLMLTRSETQKEPVADQIVFVEPIQYGITQEISFVFDQLYGTKSSDILVNHIDTVLKTYRRIITRFPDCKISVCITSACMASSGLSTELLHEKLAKRLGDALLIESLDEIEVDVSASVLSDHYIEFGQGGPREAGKRKTGGLIISKRNQ